MASTTDTIKKLTQPEKTASQLASEIQFPDITDGTEKQVKYAKDLRANFLAEISSREYSANLRWAVIKIGRNEQLSDADIRLLAVDAWNRKVIGAINTNSAKSIIDHFAGVNGQTRKNDSIQRYQHIIRNPSKWMFDGKSWKKI